MAVTKAVLFSLLPNFTVGVDLCSVVDQKADRVEPAGSRDGDERSDAVSIPDVDLCALRHEVRNHFRLPEICSLAAPQGYAGQRADFIDFTLKRGVSPPMSTFSMLTLPVEMRYRTISILPI